MVRIGIRELRQNASTWVRRAAGGERVEISRRGVVVAVLGPPPSGDVVARLRAEGRLRAATVDRATLPPPIRSGQSVSDALLAVRDVER